MGGETEKNIAKSQRTEVYRSKVRRPPTVPVRALGAEGLPRDGGSTPSWDGVPAEELQQGLGSGSGKTGSGQVPGGKKQEKKGARQHLIRGVNPRILKVGGFRKQ